MTPENTDILDRVIRTIMAVHGEQTADLIKAWDELDERDEVVHRLQDISTKDCEQIDALREELDALREELAETKADALALLEERDALIENRGFIEPILRLQDQIRMLESDNHSLKEDAVRLNIALASEQAVTKDLEGVIQDLEETITVTKDPTT